jgi:Fe-S-cluster containining protein
MNDPLLNRSALKELLAESNVLRLRLKEQYTLIPPTRCKRRTLCCSLLPEMTFLEALAVISLLRVFSPEARLAILQRIVTYFFINPTAITACPFLEETECLIYPQRFFGCRAYGLWSPVAHAQVSRQNRQSKVMVREQWNNMGVFLPREVVEFQVPYCPSVEWDRSIPFDDESLERIEESIGYLSAELEPWHRQFRDDYYSDLSFFLAGLIFGRLPAVRHKYFIVKEILETRSRTRLNSLLDGLEDSFFT